jgi:predicted ATP-grasp superfamily ATP-dependent carboligase
MTSDPDSPQVMILGVDSPIGLAMIRELARHGVRVHGIGGSPRSLGLFSRRLATRHVRAQGDEALAAQIRSIAAATGCRWIMTVSEGDILTLQRLRADIAPVTAIIADQDPMRRVLDKAATLAAAAKVGIETPHTWHWTSLAEVTADRNALTYPLVLKWRDPARVQPLLGRAGLRFDKSRYIYGFDDLRTYLSPLVAVGELPLAQRFHPGYGLGQMAYMRGGEAWLRFQHRRLAEWPPEGGCSTVAESVALTEHADLFERSIALLREIGFEGPAMVEYRYDPQSGRAVLMEINGRFWGSLPLAYHAGAPFVWTSYATRAIGESPPPTQPDYQAGMTCRYLIPELKRLARITLQPHLVQDRALRFNPWREWARFLLAYFDPKTRYYVFEAGDPAPFFSDLWFAATKSLRR